MSYKEIVQFYDEGLFAPIISTDSVHVVVSCPACGCIHKHGSGGEDQHFNMRVPHCNSDLSQNKKPRYYILVDPIRANKIFKSNKFQYSLKKYRESKQ